MCVCVCVCVCVLSTNLEQEGVAGLVVDGLLDARHVGDGQVVAHDLGRAADRRGHLGPRGPVVLNKEKNKEKKRVNILK